MLQLRGAKSNLKLDQNFVALATRAAERQFGGGGKSRHSLKLSAVVDLWKASLSGAITELQALAKGAKKAASSTFSFEMRRMLHVGSSMTEKSSLTRAANPALAIALAAAGVSHSYGSAPSLQVPTGAEERKKDPDVLNKVKAKRLGKKERAKLAKRRAGVSSESEEQPKLKKTRPEERKN